MKKQYAVLGLGSFGWSVATTLETMGCDVLAVDESYEKFRKYRNRLPMQSKRMYRIPMHWNLWEAEIWTAW